MQSYEQMLDAVSSRSCKMEKHIIKYGKCKVVKLNMVVCVGLMAFLCRITMRVGIQNASNVTRNIILRA